MNKMKRWERFNSFLLRVCYLKQVWSQRQHQRIEKFTLNCFHQQHLGCRCYYRRQPSVTLSIVVQQELSSSSAFNMTIFNFLTEGGFGTGVETKMELFGKNAKNGERMLNCILRTPHPLWKKNPTMQFPDFFLTFCLSVCLLRTSQASF